MKNILIGVVIGAVMVAGALLIRNSRYAAQTLVSESPQVAGIEVPLSAVVHKTPTCGCCANYITYLKRQGFEVEVQNHDDLTSIKEQYNIPAGLESCHTTVIGDYVSEGHVPAAHIARMLAEKPAFRGITLPGMPAGAPGMGGIARGDVAVYSFSDSGAIERYGE